MYTFRESHKSLLNIGQRRKNIIASKQTQEKRRSFHHVYSKEIFEDTARCQRCNANGKTNFGVSGGRASCVFLMKKATSIQQVLHSHSILVRLLSVNICERRNEEYLSKDAVGQISHPTFCCRRKKINARAESSKFRPPPQYGPRSKIDSEEEKFEAKSS